MAYDASSQKGITEIMVRGFKSLYDESRIEIRPLTILAGANSSGKSSIMQPLLLLKQTLEAPYDPGPLLLDGPNVTFTQVAQLLSAVADRIPVDHFQVALEVRGMDAVTNTFQKLPDEDLTLLEMIVESGGEYYFVLRPVMTRDEVAEALDAMHQGFGFPTLGKPRDGEWTWEVVRERCFYELNLYSTSQHNGKSGKTHHYETNVSSVFDRSILGLLHLPGLRATPARIYPKTATGPNFPGTFDKYIASVILDWHGTNNNRQAALDKALALLGLTGKITARRLNDAQIELLVARLPPYNGNSDQDMVNIADVGFGVSQTLPVLVALLAAEPGQLVYLEQPEIHLHPRAQVALAEVLADAARRGVRVVAETHSSLLLLGIQTLVAGGKLDPELVKLHWFKRDEQTGVTKITSADLDERGAFGEWPEDFADVELSAEHNYLNASLFREVPR
jgi:predicted ATPase